MENAGEEGMVTFYAATNFRDTQEIVAAFDKHYPFIKVAFSSLGGPGVLNKIVTEHRAGVYQADVLALTGTYGPELIVDQAVRFSRQSHTFMTQLVATGEHDLIVDGYIHNALALKDKGAPIEYVVMNPTIARPPSIIGLPPVRAILMLLLFCSTTTFPKRRANSW